MLTEHTAKSAVWSSRTVGLFCFFLSFFVALTTFGAEAPKSFSIPAGAAERTLKTFADQSGRSVIFATEKVKGITTNEVKGEFTAEKALDQLLSGTKLSAVPEKATGGFAIRREASVELAEKNASGRRADSVAASETDRVAPSEGIITLDKYEVNGLRITGIINQGVIPREENQAVRFDVMNRDDIERTGLTDFAEIFRYLPLNQNNGTGSQQSAQTFTNGSGFANQTGDLLNLRGLGPSGTLVLINGRRLYSADGAGSEVSRIPLSAVERIEILPGSAGAMYGGNAVGGVINVILRTGFDASEISAYFGDSTHGGAAQQRYNIFTGRSFNKGRTNVNVSFSYKHQGDLRQGDRDYGTRALAAIETNPLTMLVSPTNTGRFISFAPMYATARPTVRATTALKIPANPAALYAAIPSGSDGVGLTPASFNATVGQFTASASNNYLSQKLLLYGTDERSVVAAADHALFGEALGVYAEFTYRNVKSDYSQPNHFPVVSIPASNPFNPFGKTVIVTWNPVDLADDSESSDKHTVRAVAGLKGKFLAPWSNGAKLNWAIDVSTDYNTDHQWEFEATQGLRNAIALGAYNPFRDLTNVPRMSPTELAKYQRQTTQDLDSRIDALDLRLNGNLFDFWGGPVSFSLVGEGHRGAARSAQSASIAPGAYADVSAGFPAAWLTRYYQSGGGELMVPLVDKHNARPGVHSLDFSFAYHYEHESGAESARTPLIAAKWSLTPDFAIRASYATGFQPPNFSDRTSPAFTQQASGINIAPNDPLRPGQPPPDVLTWTFVGNPNIRPETSTTWDAGIIETPRALPGLTVTVNYFRISKHDAIRPVGTVDFATTALYFPQYVLRDPPTAADIAAGRPGAANTWIDTALNAGRVFTDGVDYKLAYDLPAFAWGRFRVDVGYTWTKRFDVQLLPNSPVLTSLDFQNTNSYAAVKQHRLVATVGWVKGAWSANLTMNYTNGYEAFTTKPSAINPTGLGYDPKYPSATIVDGQISYQIASLGGHGRWRDWLNGTKWTLGAQNLADREPALVTAPGAGFYDSTIDPRQCFIYLSVRKAF